MQNSRKINNDLYYIGASDRRLSLFENVYPIPRGVSYNSYVMLDEKTTLLDTADAAVGRQFFENLAGVLQGRDLDYMIINHMEPDHCALIEEVLLRYPHTTIVTNKKASEMIRQFFDLNLDGRLMIVGEGDSLNTGRHCFHFVMAPMVHWPEAMVSYDSCDHILFSADAFGTFGALNGNIFADEVEFEREWLNDARRYFTNIVGKYGPQVQALLKKAATLEIDMICPLHGPIWRTNINWFVHKYDLWSTYKPECKGVAIVYGSVYGNTEAAANLLAAKLADKGIRNIKMYDVSHTDVSKLVSETFHYSHLVLAAATYNAGIFTPMENFLLDLKAHNMQQRTCAIIENGTWAPQSGKMMRALLEQMKGMTVLGENFTLKSSMKASQEKELDQLADLLVESLNK